MKKHRYRTKSVKRVDLDRLSLRLPLDRLVVGTDVAKEEMFGALMAAPEEVLTTLTWDHLSESQAFVGWLRRVLNWIKRA